MAGQGVPRLGARASGPPAGETAALPATGSAKFGRAPRAHSYLPELTGPGWGRIIPGAGHLPGRTEGGVLSAQHPIDAGEPFRHLTVARPGNLSGRPFFEGTL